MSTVLLPLCGPNCFYVYSHQTRKSQQRHIDECGKPCYLLAYQKLIHIGMNYEMMNFGGKMSAQYAAWGTVKGKILGLGRL